MFENPTTRRIFLQKGLTMLAVGATVPTFLDQTVMAIANPLDTHRTQQPNGKDGKILVVVQLSGGNDGINTVVPWADPSYHRARPALAHNDKEVLKIDSYVGLHPSLGPLKSLYEDGRMSIIQGVGYPNPNRSHFRSMDIWHTAQPEKDIAGSGWLGRYFDNQCAGCDPHVGVSVGDQLPLAMRGDRITPLSFERPENYRYNGRDKDDYMKLNKIDLSKAPPAPSTQPALAQGGVVKPQPKNKQIEITPAEQLDFLHRTAMDAQVSSDDILRMVRGHDGSGYPNGEFGTGLRTVAAMIKGGLPTRVYYVSLGGFDTHANEKGRHDQLMQQFSQGVSAFMKDLKDQGNDDRVLMMTFSEFGRRVEQNASGGTDHGTAAPMFVFGKAVKNGLLGRYPSLTDLDHGDLKYTTDFRNVYATVLQDWLDAPSKPILGQQFKTLEMVKA
ncbi:MAG TPA: DUF1501 domain-containing protein [Tepidisphaeraceae bacterium]|nr:DUF1501 domain-containing protein [Tepidisphaeraceae bacterium]